MTPSRGFQHLSTSTSLGTSMLGWVQTVSLGLRVFGDRGIGKRNENGQRLLEVCCFHNLCVTSTYFRDKDRRKASWTHPRFNHWHLLDLVITRADSINNVCNTKAYQSADCDTDHSSVASWVKVTPKGLQYAKKKCQPRINTNHTLDPEKNVCSFSAFERP